ncbi:MAG TPA: methyltransferase domain-containing protein [Streptosporangiaceae bacterium]|nr:methyltransferase domain-containing protein [Streptosporangiaceae bacterium]
MSNAFAAGEGTWRARLGTLRQVVRMELITRQLAAHVPDRPSRRVLDIGCGQGTQVVRLARRGHQVTGLDSSEALLGDLEQGLGGEDSAVRGRVRLVRGEARQVTSLLAGETFDVVLCHGVLMYVADPAELLDPIAAVIAPGGLVSLLVRNGDALAMRPGQLGDWAAADAAFDGAGYRNRIGVQARADRLADLTAALAERRLTVRQWYGVRVLTDLAADDAPVPDAAELELIVSCEERAGSRDPYRGVAPLVHVLAWRDGPA